MPRLPRTLRPWCIPAALLLAVIALSPNRARAECGDYLMIAGHHAAADHGNSDAPAKPNVPCQGPNCSRRHDAPLLPPAPPPNVLLIDQAVLADGPPAPTPGDHGRTFESSEFHPIDRSDPIFHPPRLDS